MCDHPNVPAIRNLERHPTLKPIQLSSPRRPSETSGLRPRHVTRRDCARRRNSDRDARRDHHDKRGQGSSVRCWLQQRRRIDHATRPLPRAARLSDLGLTRARTTTRPTPQGPHSAPLPFATKSPACPSSRASGGCPRGSPDENNAYVTLPKPERAINSSWPRPCSCLSQARCKRSASQSGSRTSSTSHRRTPNNLKGR